MSAEKMNCPKCGTQMNHHADKPDYSAALTEPETVDPELAGILEVHACPACGNTEVRKSAFYSILKLRPFMGGVNPKS